MDHARERGSERAVNGFALADSPHNIEGKGHRLSNPILVPDGVRLDKSWDPGVGWGWRRNQHRHSAHEPWRVDSLSFPNSNLKRSTFPPEVKSKFNKSPHDRVNPDGGT